MLYNLTGEININPTISGNISKSRQISGDLNVTGFGGGMSYVIGNGLKLEGNTLSVDTANEPEQDNTKPITSAAVYETVGNIEVLLGTI